VAGLTPVCVARVYGNYSLERFATTFDDQVGTLTIFTQGTSNYYSPDRPVAHDGGTEIRSGRWSSDGFSFAVPDRYHSAGPNGNLVLTRN
jgi:hypothetical protein